MKNSEKNFEKIVNLCKSRGFIFPGSEIYGGLANAWDYGPLGVELKNNLKKVWWKKFVQEIEYNVGLDCSILMNPAVWVASGHVGNFSDPLIDCKVCKQRFRADSLIESAGVFLNAGASFDEMSNLIRQEEINCPNCGSCDFTEIRSFNLMFKTFQGVTANKQSELFLRPETAQGIFINFLNVQRTMRKKLPFGVAQIGKSFRNEITPGNFIFRTREFEQMELEFFYEPETDFNWFEYWKKMCFDFFVKLGVKFDSLKFRDHSKEELSHYSKETTDVEFEFPFGWGELCGIANRGDFDLKCHQEHSKKSLEYFDAKSNEKILPFCIEPSIGVDRACLAVLCDAFDEEYVGDDSQVRIVLRLNPVLAPFKACVLPLTKKLSENALKIYRDLSKNFMVDFDESGSIGKRYRRQDEIGTPFCFTFDFESVDSNSVTVRYRDSMKQERIKIDNLRNFLEKELLI